MPSKLVPLTLKEMWKCRKPSLQHIHIWGCQTHGIKQKVNKLEARLEVFLFVSVSKRDERALLYSQVNQKVFVSTNAKFLEEYYMMK